jgi:hypothetical protein
MRMGLIAVINDYNVGRMRTILYYLDDLKLDGIPWLQRSVAFAHDVGVMNENVWTVFLSDKSVALYVAERLDFAVHWTCFLGGSDARTVTTGQASQR